MINTPRQIIICGSNRSGSTSLFKYLSAHPNICPSNIKQTNFFIDADIIKRDDLEVIYHHSKDANRYSDYYQVQPHHQFLLEASPDYMYSENTPELIKDFFIEKPLLIFILREPNDRLQSWFKFGKQIGKVPSKEPFEEFFRKCTVSKEEKSKPYQAIETADYYTFLKPFYDTFSSDSIHTIFFDSLVSQPLEVVKDILAKLNLEITPYKKYEFEKFNASLIVKNRLIKRMYGILRKKYHSYNKGRTPNKILFQMSQWFKAKMFNHKNEKESTSTNKVPVIDQVNKTYLEHLIDARLPW